MHFEANGLGECQLGATFEFYNYAPQTATAAESATRESNKSLWPVERIRELPIQSTDRLHGLCSLSPNRAKKENIPWRISWSRGSGSARTTFHYFLKPIRGVYRMVNCYSRDFSRIEEKFTEFQAGNSKEEVGGVMWGIKNLIFHLHMCV